MASPCPKCGFDEVGDAAECPRCGVIVAKARAPMAAGVLRYREVRRRSVNGWLALVVATPLLAGAGYLVAHLAPEGDEGRGAPDPGDAVAAAAADAGASTTVYVLAGKPELKVPAGSEDGPRDAAAPRARRRHGPKRPAPTPAGTSMPQQAAADPAWADGVRMARRFPKRRWPSRQWLDGAEGYERGWREMRDTRAPLLVYFRTDWCPHCRKADEGLLPAAPVKAAGEQLVKVRINPEAGPAERAIADKFGVKGYPSFYIVPPDGKGPRKVPRVRDPEGFAVAVTKSAQQARHTVVQRGIDLQKAKRQKAAITQLTLATQAWPDNADAYYWRAMAHKAQHRPAEAVADLLRAVQVQPDHLHARGQLASLALDMNRPDEAVGQAEEITRRDDGFQRGFAWALRATAEQRRGRPEHARKAARRACRYGDRPSCEWLRARPGEPTAPAAGVRSDPAQAADWGCVRRGDRYDSVDRAGYAFFNGCGRRVKCKVTYGWWCADDGRPTSTEIVRCTGRPGSSLDCTLRKGCQGAWRWDLVSWGCEETR